MNGEIQQLKRKFNEIIKMGWIESDKINYGIIGEAFEKLIGLTKNNFEIPDFGNIEIKTKSKGKFNHICLFNCAPTGPHYHEVEIIKDTFGYPDLSLKEYKVFNGDVYCNKLNKIGFKFYFKLNVHKEENKITLNEYLLKANIRCIQYVILHELTHLLYPNHSSDFYNFLTIHMPDWKDRKKQLDTEIVQSL